MFLLSFIFIVKDESAKLVQKKMTEVWHQFFKMRKKTEEVSEKFHLVALL